MKQKMKRVWDVDTGVLVLDDPSQPSRTLGNDSDVMTWIELD